MDPLSSLSLVSSTIQIVDFMVRLIAGSKTIYQSGNLKGYETIETVTESLLELESKFKEDRIRRYLHANKEIRDIAARCQGVAKELRLILETLKLHKKSAWESFRVALRAVRKKSEVEGLCSEIFWLQCTLLTHLQCSLLTNQSEMTNALHDLYQWSKKWDVPTDDSLYAALGRLRETVEAISHRFQDATPSSNYTDLSQQEQIVLKSISSDVKDMSTALNAFRDETLLAQRCRAFLQSIVFNNIFTRQDGVAASHPNTSTWIFSNHRILRTASQWVFYTMTPDGRHVSFSDWLENGVGVYWICGKPGSGKSTLMKFIAGSDTTTAKLQKWAGGKRLVLASHFFWTNGSKLQKSQEGLLRTLLFTIFRRCPDMIPKIMESLDDLIDDWHVWKFDDLLKVIQHLAKWNLGIKFCFLIDGLDEYEGDHGSLIALFHELSQSQYVKICVSSRPWTQFVDAYGQDPSRFLKLEDFTQDDIRKFVLDTFHSHEIFQAHVTDPRYTKLVETIVERANGVFLWVFLACKSLLDGMRHADRLIDLERRLTSVPPDFESFFKQMILSTDNVYKKQTARLILITLAMPKPLPLAIYWVLDILEEDPHAQIDSSQFNSLYHVKQMSRRLDARSKGLVEIRRQNNKVFDDCDGIDLSKFIVEFIHGSVRDFLQPPAVKNIFLESAGDDFDSDVLLCEAFVAVIAIDLPFGTPDFIGDTIVYHAGNIERSKGITLPCLERLDTHHGEMFLTKAVEAGLSIYVGERLRRNKLLLYAHQQSRPLLDVALCVSTPSYAMISILLENGANPNEYYCETTVWGAFLDWIVMGGVESELSLHYSEFKEILALLIRFGAPLSYRLNSGQCAESVIWNKFERWDAEYILSSTNRLTRGYNALMFSYTDLSFA